MFDFLLAQYGIRAWLGVSSLTIFICRTYLVASTMNHFLKSLVIGFVIIICLIMLSDISVSASAQNQTAGENMAGGNQNMTAQQEGTSVPNSMVVGNQSSGGAAPGYVQVRSSREVNASADQTLEYFMNIQDLPRFSS